LGIFAGVVSGRSRSSRLILRDRDLLIGEGRRYRPPDL
jgi:hypothetical protein